MTTSENPRWRVALEVPAGPRSIRLDFASDAPCLALAGPSGAGKSTIVRSLAGVARGVRGTLHFKGIPWLDSGLEAVVPPWSRRVAWCPQDAPLFPHLDVRANLLASAEHLPSELPRVAEALDIGHLLDRRPRHLSGGERHRVALGRALLAKADVWLLDEPFAALDRALRTRVTEYVRALASQRGVSVVLVTHESNDRAFFGAETWELEDGRLVRR